MTFLLISQQQHASGGESIGGWATTRETRQKMPVAIEVKCMMGKVGVVGRL